MNKSHLRLNCIYLEVPPLLEEIVDAVDADDLVDRVINSQC